MSLLLYFSFFFFLTFELQGTLTVLVASENPLKCAAVKEVFQEHFTNEEITLLSCPSRSNVPEQPVGSVSAVKGARNRIESIPQNVLDRADYIVSIENFIEYDGSWVDSGAVVIRNREKETVIFTKSVPLPQKYVERARSLSYVDSKGYSITVGKVIQAAYGSRCPDAGDWHQMPEFGGISRKEFIKAALLRALQGGLK